MHVLAGAAYRWVEDLIVRVGSYSATDGARAVAEPLAQAPLPAGDACPPARPPGAPAAPTRARPATPPRLPSPAPADPGLRTKQ